MSRATSLGGIAALMLSTPALAWEHTTVVWTPTQMPIVVQVADDGEPNSIQACEKSGGMSGCCEEGVPAGYCLEATVLGFEAWEDAQCAEWEVDVLDSIENPALVAPNLPSSADVLDPFNYITFNDPGWETGDGTIAEIGTRAVTLSRTNGNQAFIFDGQIYREHTSSDIVFNENTEFISQPDIEAGRCSGSEASLLSTMTHEIGHFMGMDHSCEDPAKGGAPCTDPVLANATMFWTGPNCDTERVTINSDDIEGITALYGPSAQFACSHEVSDDQVIGVVPFTLRCVIVSDFLNEVTGATWTFGDGGTSTELNAEHEYTEAGNYTIQVNVQGEREACGDDGWENNFRRVGYVRACDIPTASFQVEQVDGRLYQMLNDSDVSVFGCISDIQWDVFAGNGEGEPIMDPIKAWEPIIDFPEAGTYTVVMSLGGIAGTGGAKATFEVRNRGGSSTSCDTTGPAGGALALVVLASMLGRRRRS
ncbi:MAG: PKD domain-containing protein [Myxococcales bacterium]|nr:PKD domain-containing protein [Myxococcales bacterium]